MGLLEKMTASVAGDNAEVTRVCGLLARLDSTVEAAGWSGRPGFGQPLATVVGNASTPPVDASSGGLAGYGKLGKLMIEKEQDLASLVLELEEAAAKHKAPAPVTPPDAAMPTLGNQAVPVPAEDMPGLPAAVASAAAAQAKAHAEEQVVSAPAESATAATAEQPKKRRRGRPKKSEQAKASTVPSTPAESGDESATTGITLYADCLPIGGADFDLDSLDAYKDAALAALCALAAEENGGKAPPHVLCAPKSSFLAYNGWEGALVAWVRANPPPDGVYVLLHVAGDKIKMAMVEALRPLCTLCVRGV